MKNRGLEEALSTHSTADRCSGCQLLTSTSSKSCLQHTQPPSSEAHPWVLLILQALTSRTIRVQSWRIRDATTDLKGWGNVGRFRDELTEVGLRARLLDQSGLCFLTHHPVNKLLCQAPTSMPSHCDGLKFPVTTSPDKHFLL